MSGGKASRMSRELKRSMIFSRYRVGLWLVSILLFRPLRVQ